MVSPYAPTGWYQALMAAYGEGDPSGDPTDPNDPTVPPVAPVVPVTPTPTVPSIPTTPGSPTDLNSLIQTLQALMTSPDVSGLSDPLSQALLQTRSQQNIAAITQAINMATQNQANQLRQTELMGANPDGTTTDAAARWRAELNAQQDVQGTRLDQELAQLLGYDDQGHSTLEARNAAAQQQQAAQQATQRWAELLGIDPSTGNETLAGRAQDANLARENTALYGVDSAGNKTLDTRKLENDVAQADAERQLRLMLQAGQLNQQESEFARNYLLQQDASRRAQSQLTGYTDDGSLTEAARASRAQEQQQRAATAADLTKSSRDVFRAGRYFREMRADPTGTGLGTGAGVSGFTTQANRDLGTPGTLSYGDVDAAIYGPAAGAQAGSSATGGTQDAGSLLASLGYSAGPAAAPAAAPSAAPNLGTALAASPSGTGAASLGAAPMPQAGKDKTNEVPGAEPGGPVGMGAGGRFVGRRVSRRADGLPQIAPDVLNDKRVTKFFRQIQAQHKGKVPGSGPGGPQGVKTFGGQLARNERFARGLKRLHAKGKLVPGMQPGGPVDAPLWPAGTGGTSPMPQLQSATSLGGQGVSPGPLPSAALPQGYGAIPDSGQVGVFSAADTTGQDQRVAAMAEWLRRYGVQGMGPQELEKQNATEKGVREGAFEALGLNNDDADQAYAQTRFHNVGNALSA